jgi:hypothetical protein
MFFGKPHRKQAAVRVRQAEEGKWLYFPYMFRRGGGGWWLDNAQEAERLKYLGDNGVLSMTTPFLLVAGLVAMLGHFSIGAILGGLVAGAGVSVLLRRWWLRMLERIVITHEQAPWRLTEERYWQELGLQYTSREWYAALLVLALMFFTVIMSVLTNIGRMFTHISMVGLLLAGLLLLGYSTWFCWKLGRGRQQARQRGITGGSVEQLEHIPLPPPADGEA